MGQAAGLTASTQTFAVSPADAATNTVSAGSSTNANRGSRQYTVAIPSDVTDVNIALVPAENVVVQNDGTVTFKSNAIVATAGVSFEVVNGASVGTAGGTETKQVNDVQPINGQITFSVDSQVVDQVIPVVYEDSISDSGNNLDLESGATSTTPKAPREKFGIGGEKDWVPAEATSGAYGPETVSMVNATDKYIVTMNGKLFRWDNDDTFTYDGGVDGAVGDYNVPMSTFEKVISKDDVLRTITYSQGASSNFAFDTDVPAKVTGVAAAEYDSDGNGSVDAIKVTWDTPPNPDVATYKVERATVSSSGTVGTWTDITASDGDGVGASNTTYQDDAADASALSGGTDYVYRVTAIADVANASAAGPVSDRSAAVTFPAGADTATPYSTAAVFIDNSTGGNSTVDANDVIRVQFNKVVDVASNASVDVIDNDGTTATITCGTTAVCSTSGSSSTLLTMQMNLQPTPTNLGGNGVLNSGIVLEITGQSGVTNANGSWNLPRSGQVAAGFDRVVSGANSDLPDGPTELSVTAGGTDTDTSITITDTVGGNATSGDTIQVFDANGTLLGSADTASDNAATAVSLSRALVNGETLYYQFVDNDATAGAKFVSASESYTVVP